MIPGGLIFTAAIFLTSILFLIPTLSYPIKAKLFPLLTLLILLILLIIQITREVFAFRRKDASEREKSGGISSKHLGIWTWLLVTLLMLLLFGFMGTVILLPFSYLRFQRESCLLSTGVALGCGIFFYALFDLGLSMPLYPGFLLSKIFG